jgi:tetratricopeptide (TPR) repeat protein
MEKGRMVNAALERAYTYSENGDYDRAIEECTQVIQTDSNNLNRSFAYYLRGSTYDEKGDTDRAIADFTEALRIGDDEAGVYFLRGIAYGRKNQVDLSLADLSKAIQLEPDKASAYYYRAGVFACNKNYSLAIKDFEKFLELAPDDSKAAQAREAIKKLQNDASSPKTENPKKWRNLLLISIFFGWAGFDRFYVGKYKTGFLKVLLLSCGATFFWWIIDIILILTERFTDKFGNAATKDGDWEGRAKNINIISIWKGFFGLSADAIRLLGSVDQNLNRGGEQSLKSGNKTDDKKIPRRIKINGEWYDASGSGGALQLSRLGSPISFTAREPFAHISGLYNVFGDKGNNIGEFHIGNKTYSGCVDAFEM